MQAVAKKEHILKVFSNISTFITEFKNQMRLVIFFHSIIVKILQFCRFQENKRVYVKKSQKKKTHTANFFCKKTQYFDKPDAKKEFRQFYFKKVTYMRSQTQILVHLKKKKSKKILFSRFSINHFRVYHTIQN